MIRHQPPTAIPVAADDFRSAVRALFDPAGYQERFRMALMGRCKGAAFCDLAASGRAALALILMALRQVSQRQQVILPAYSCPTVVQAVLFAGLRPVFCDVSPLTLGLDRQALARLIEQKPLAILPTHLYGLAQEIRDLLALGKAQGLWIVEDATQAFGARLGGQMVGTLGEAGFYSLGRGKCLPAGHGGVIVAQEELTQVLSDVLRAQLPAAMPAGVGGLAAFLAYAALTHPVGWWFVARSPLNPALAGTRRADLPPLRVGRLSAVQAGLGLSILARLDQIQAIGQRNAALLMERLDEFAFISFFAAPPDASSVYLRLPFLVADESRASLLYERLHQAGIGVSKSYRGTLPQLFPEYGMPGQAFSGAERLANCLLTLPTHSHLSERDFDTISGVFRSIHLV